MGARANVHYLQHYPSSTNNTTIHHTTVASLYIVIITSRHSHQWVQTIRRLREPSLQGNKGRFAQVGMLIFYEELKLKEVSEMTADTAKYICNHRVTGRVKLHKVLNPEAWDSSDTYLKVKGTITDDTYGGFDQVR